ncbi:MAG: class I SAM-dependent methyltransferase [Pseudomonadales bacterium]|nr:class I SAM-dependent methyltransferase [Pseudomonadales bacterium]
MAIYAPPSIRRFSADFMCFSTWVDHLAFGYDIVAALRPALTVELGTQGGLSFFCFCQSLKENEIDGIAYAVDTWEGEEHTGKYDESVFNSVQEHARKNHAGRAYLMRMLFQEAINHFSDESIDLLHIDGLHTYDAVKEDFTTWLPKVRPGGVILFHDIQARMMDFGAWKFWEELSASGEYKTMEFKHGFGLGVLQKNGGPQNEHTLLKLLFDASPDEHGELRAFYIHAAKFLELQRKVERQERMKKKRQAEMQAKQKNAQA